MTTEGYVNGLCILHCNFYHVEYVSSTYSHVTYATVPYVTQAASGFISPLPRLSIAVLSVVLI